MMPVKDKMNSTSSNYRVTLKNEDLTENLLTKFLFELILATLNWEMPKKFVFVICKNREVLQYYFDSSSFLIKARLLQ